MRLWDLAPRRNVVPYHAPGPVTNLRSSSFGLLPHLEDNSIYAFDPHNRFHHSGIEIPRCAKQAPLDLPAGDGNGFHDLTGSSYTVSWWWQVDDRELDLHPGMPSLPCLCMQQLYAKNKVSTLLSIRLSTVGHQINISGNESISRTIVPAECALGLGFQNYARSFITRRFDRYRHDGSLL